MQLTTHNYTVTLVSPKTGDHRTFRIKTVRKGTLTGKRVVELLTGRDNENDYRAFAFVNDEGSVNVWNKFWRVDNGIFAKYGDMLMRQEYWEERGVQYLPEGRCIRCNRKLTHPDSIISGMGQECASRTGFGAGIEKAFQGAYPGTAKKAPRRSRKAATATV